MTRYTPTTNDRLIETIAGRRNTHTVTDVDGPEVTYERPDGTTVTTMLTTLRRDLHRGRFAVEEAI